MARRRNTSARRAAPMAAVRLGELGELLHSSAFSTWWTEYRHAIAALEEARTHHGDLAWQVETMRIRSDLARRSALALSRARAREGATRAPPPGRGEARDLERSLMTAERVLAGRRLRREEERLREEVRARRARARQLASEARAADRDRAAAEERRRALLGEARVSFGCAAGDRFLYWGRAEDGGAFAVALADDPDCAKVEVKALSIHVVGRARGATSLEPVRDGLVLAVERAGARRQRARRGGEG